MTRLGISCTLEAILSDMLPEELAFAISTKGPFRH